MSSYLGLSFLIATLLLQAGPIEVVVKGAPPKTLRAEVVRENLKGITLKVDGAVLAYGWTDLETIGGRPAKEHLAQLKEARKSAWCVDCKGGRVSLVCPDCLATGKVFQRSVACEPCKGTGLGAVPCGGKGCQKGKVECPGPCLKRSVGVWKDMPGVGPVRIFHYPGGNLSASERHLGEIFEFKEIPAFALPSCPTCKGTAKSPCRDCRQAGTFVEKAPRSLGQCPSCVRGQVSCGACGGLGSRPCDACLGAKSVPAPDSAVACTACTEGVVLCAPCGDSGVVDASTRPGRMSAGFQSLRNDIRKALQTFQDAPPPALDRVVLRDGRRWEGAVVGRADKVILLATAEGGGIRLAPVFVRHGYRLERLATPAKPTSAEPEAAAAAATEGPDTVILKDGSSVNGQIVARSETLIMVKTPDGKFVKIEASNVAEVKTAPKTPKLPPAKP